MLPSNDTTIDLLKIRGRKPHCDQVQRALSIMEWPEPLDHAWIFVRSLHIQAPAHRAATVVNRHVKQAVTQRTNSENIVRFETLDELLSALIGDLLQGKAEQQWYWQRWSNLFSTSLSSAMKTLLAEHSEQSTAVIERLWHKDLLRQFWQALSEQDAASLWLELAHQGGYRAQYTDFGDDEDRSNQYADQPLSVASIPDKKAKIWHYSLSQVPHQSARQRWIFWLVARQFWPLALVQAPKETIQSVYQWWQRYSSKSDIHPKQTPFLSTDEQRLDTAAEQHGDSHHHAKSSLEETDNNHPEDFNSVNENLPTEFNSKERLSAIKHSDGQGKKTAESNAQGRPKELDQYAQFSMEKVEEKASKDSAPVQTKTLSITAPNRWTFREASHQHDFTEVAEYNRFSTKQGGCLYLLNVLQRPEMQSILSDYWSIYPSGWFWLYRLAESLGLDPDDPLTLFILAEMGVSNEFPLSSLPPLPESERIRVLLAQWYDQETLWNADLLSVPARIQTSASHIDLFASLNSVRLEVRLAGLDVNPGWLPWLGRVVQFHFQEYGSQ